MPAEVLGRDVFDLTRRHFTNLASCSLDDELSGG